MEQKYDRQYLPYGVTLHRYYIGNSPDVCGTIAEWTAKANEMRKYMPFDALFKYRDWYVYHMDSPILDQMAANKQSSLEDFDLSTQGYQAACGLYFGNCVKTEDFVQDTDPDRSRIEVGVFPPGWQPGPVYSPNPVEQRNIDGMLRAFDHEFGHMYQHACGYGDSSTEIRKVCNSWYDNNRQHQTESPYEDGAETYKILFSDGKCFSDNTVKPVKPELDTFMKVWYWLQGNLSGKVFKNFTVASSMIWWEEFTWEVTGYQTFLFFSQPIYGWKSKGWFGVNRNWEKMKWVSDSTSGKWEKV